jgi:glutamate-1-semialdehyde 2,1-aminomutase
MTLNCSKAEKLYSALIKEYETKTRKSKELFEKARQILPASVTYKIRDFYPYPPYIIKAKDEFVIDVDGNQYIDFWMGHGALIFGHSNRLIVEMIKSQAELGTHYGYEHPLAIKWAETIKRNYPPMELIRFTNSGTEANIYALRLARSATGKKKIAKIQGGWHGSYNGLHVNVHPPFTGKPESPGIPEEFSKYTITIQLNNNDDLRRKLLENKNDLAALIMEPVLGAGGGISASKEFVEEARELCDKIGCILIFDEVITGFRVSLSGGYRYLGVKPDLAVMGKIIGGGLPVGAFGGKEEIMRLLDHRENEKHVFQGGTFSGNPLTASAGIAAIRYLENHQDVYSKLEYMFDYAKKRINEISQEYKQPVYVTGAPGILGFHFTQGEPRDAEEVFSLRYCNEIYPLINLYLRNKGILYVSETIMHLLPSIHHTIDELEEVLKGIEYILNYLS